MRAVLLHEPRRLEVAALPDPAPAPGDVILAVEASPQCGTDIHVYDGNFAPTLLRRASIRSRTTSPAAGERSSSPSRDGRVGAAG